LCRWTKYVQLMLQCKTNTISILMHKMRISTTPVSPMVLRPKKLGIRKKCEYCKTAKEIKQSEYCAMTLSQIRRMIELCMREIIFVFKWLYQLYFFLDSFIHLRILNQVPNYFATGLLRSSGTYSKSTEASTKYLKCETNTAPILMPQMRIPTNQISSKLLRPKKCKCRFGTNVQHVIMNIFKQTFNICVM
jgi:hypothetical protein